MVLVNFVYAKMIFCEVGILAAGAVGGVGKKGNNGLFAGVFNECFGGVFDDGVELFFGGLLIDAAVGESKSFAVFLADETAGEVFGFEGKIILAGDNDIARREIYTGNKGIDLVVLKHFGCSDETVGGEKINIGEGCGGLLCETIGVDFGKDDFEGWGGFGLTAKDKFVIKEEIEDHDDYGSKSKSTRSEHKLVGEGEVDSASDVVGKFVKWGDKAKKLGEPGADGDGKKDIPDKKADNGVLGDAALFPGDFGVGDVGNNNGGGGGNKSR